MLSTAATNTSSVTTYDGTGKGLPLFRSESARRIAVIPGQSSTTAENYQDKVTLSASGIEKSQKTEDTENNTGNPSETDASGGGKATEIQPKNGIQQLTPAEEKMVQELKTRDQEVKTHEMAHLANAGQYAKGGATYSYQQGPDGRRYAIGGEVPIDLSKEKTPEQTIRKMEAIKRAAMAPAEPSSADRSVAAAATATETQARQEVQETQTGNTPEQKKTETISNTTDKNVPDSDAAAESATPRTQPLDIVA